MIQTFDRAAASRFLRFSAVGMTGLVVDMGILLLLVCLGGFAPSVAKAIACELAILNNFWWNDRWTFRGFGVCDSGSRLSRLLRFNATSLGGMAANVALFHAFTAWMDLTLPAANVIAILIVALLNFHLSSRWAWGPVGGKESG